MATIPNLELISLTCPGNSVDCADKVWRGRVGQTHEVYEPTWSSSQLILLEEDQFLSWKYCENAISSNKSEGVKFVKTYAVVARLSPSSTWY